MEISDVLVTAGTFAVGAFAFASTASNVTAWLRVNVNSGELSVIQPVRALAKLSLI